MNLPPHSQQHPRHPNDVRGGRILQSVADASRRRLADAAAPHLEAQVTLDLQQQALLGLGRWLQAAGYHFAAVTPATHQLAIRRRGHVARSLRDVFGWSLPFDPSVLPPAAFALLHQAGALDCCGEGFRSAVRYCSIADLLLVHAAHPTDPTDAMLVGPDSHRFAALIERELRDHPRPAHHIVDIGCGTGVGGLLAARLLASDQPRLLLTDINPLALRYAAINAHLAGQFETHYRCGDGLSAVKNAPDLILCNPPCLVDNAERLYDHGGGALGCKLAIRLIAESVVALAPGGRLILCTGAPVIDGVDRFKQAIQPLLARRDIDSEYGEIDPDVYGEALHDSAYRDVERIAGVGLIVRRH